MDILSESVRSKNLDSREFIYQFLPKCLEGISKEKYIIHNGTKLKSEYIIDIVHNLILKYYFKKQNTFPLSSTILRRKYGSQYSKYILYLTESNILSLDKNYLNGSNSRVYSLNKKIISDEIIRFKNKDRVLLKKYSESLESCVIDNCSSIDLDIKLKLVSDLKSVEIEFDKAIFYLDSNQSDLDSYNRSKYSTESIKEGHIFYHFDKYGRMHTNFTILKSFLRKNCLLIDGEETCEVDINNSQPLFLSKLMKTIGSDNCDEVSLFSYLVDNGKYYQYVMDKLKMNNKSDAKDLTYRVLFGQNKRSSPYDIMFRSIFPTVYKFIVMYKREHSDYKVLSHHLQKMESETIFNKIIRRIIDSSPEVKIVTVHDSIIVQKRWGKLVSDIFDDEISKI